MRHRGFSLIEAASLCVCVAVLAAVVAPTLAGPRRAARLQTSQDNLRFWGVASATYTLDFAGLMPSYSWRAGGTYPLAGYQGQDVGYITIPPDSPGSNQRTFQAQAYQETDILRRMTGRLDGPDEIQSLLGSSLVLPHRRRMHLVMLDHLGMESPDRLAADPQDRNLLVWQRDPIAFEESGPWPQAATGGEDQFEGYTPVVQRWPHSSSYQTTVSVYSFDQRGPWGETVGPVQGTSNLFNAGAAPFGNRHVIEVAFPANKVFMFEWHDRHSRAQDLWYAYAQARPNKLMFDGGVQDRPTGEAGMGFNPNDPDNPEPGMHPYTPLTTDPPPLAGEEIMQPVWYRFTRGGLAGIDYTP